MKTATPYTYTTSRDGNRISHYRYTTEHGPAWDLAHCTGPTDTSRRACSGDHWGESDGERCPHCFLNQTHTLDQHRAAIARHDEREAEYQRTVAYVRAELAAMA